MVEWAVLAVVIVVFLSGFFGLVLPKLQANGVKAGIEASLLERLTTSPPQLFVIDGTGQPANGVTLLSDVNEQRFNFEAYNFLASVKAALDPTIESFGMDPDDFSYCIGICKSDGLVTESNGSEEVPITRSSQGEGIACSDIFRTILQSANIQQWAQFNSKDVGGMLHFLSSAYADSPTVDYCAVLGALDAQSRVCTQAQPCVVSGNITTQHNAEYAPIKQAEETPPVPTPSNTPTLTPTPTPTPTPTVTPTPTPTLAQSEGGGAGPPAPAVPSPTLGA